MNVIVTKFDFSPACPLHCDECTGNGVDHTDCKAGHCDSGYFVNRDKDCQRKYEMMMLTVKTVKYAFAETHLMF